MCLRTDGGWYCSCGILKPNENFGVCLFIKNFEKLHEDAVQHYLWKQKEEFYVLF